MVMIRVAGRSVYTVAVMADTHMASSDGWDVWIDTGGTFTDCMARRIGQPSHETWRRAKVLSTGALRGTIVQRVHATQLQIAQQWGACDDFIAGFRLFRLDRPDSSCKVIRFDSQHGVMEIDRDPDFSLKSGDSFEVRGAEPAPIVAARLVTQTPAGQPLPQMRMRLATTRGTNALLERQGARIALFITKGFADLLNIGDQQRPDLFALEIRKRIPLHDCVVEVPERLQADGSVLTPIDMAHVAKHAKRLHGEGYRAAAVALMHSYVNDSHERQVVECLRAVGFTHLSASAQLAPLIRLLPRTQTAVVDAYLAPVIAEYLRDVQQHLELPAHGQSTLHVMTSAGGLVKADAYRACDSLLSGPAGGVAGAAAVAQQSGFHRIIGFDMGGTSTDVARFDGDFAYSPEHEIAGVRVMMPSLAIETVAAGGGSICDCINGSLIVGPHSAGANPGPACYGFAGAQPAFTLTDVNLLLGRLVADRFEIPIHRQPAEQAANTVMSRRGIRDANEQPTMDSLLAGFLEIANQRMAAAIERVSVSQGVDPHDYALVAFGGAGGQHACAVAERLGMMTALMPADASLLSALGLGLSPMERIVQRQLLMLLQDSSEHVLTALNQAAHQAIAGVQREGIEADHIVIRRRIVHARLKGQDSTLPIECTENDLLSSHAFIRAVTTGFVNQFRRMYGHDVASEMVNRIEIESIFVAASSQSTATHHRSDPPQPFSPTIKRMQSMFANGSWRNVPAFDRGDLAPGAEIVGPALVLDRHSTCVIESGWSAIVDHAHALVAQRIAAHPNTPVAQRARSDGELVKQELFENRLAAIADEMGQLLQRVALSTNVKERLDFSCAILNAAGELVVNAPHIPVHLGALGVCVRAVRTRVKMEAGDVVITNHPGYGGSHLPDVTVITPVFVDGELIAYAANRAHHAEIGGTRPGSMPPAARSLAEEGVVIPPMHLIRRGESQFDLLEQLLRSGPHPSRAVRDNLADLRAAVAANQRGVDSLQRLARDIGCHAFKERMAALSGRAEHALRHAVEEFIRKQSGESGGASCDATEHLDDGWPLHVHIDFNSASDPMVTVDFSGSGGVHPGNLNATPAIIRSAVMYVLRLLIESTSSRTHSRIQPPLNEGMLRSVEIKIPVGLLNPPFVDDPAHCPAVVGGNTETSQRVVDVLLKALNLCACSQGTMNNVLFGNDRFGYYETVCGGSGAGHGFHGADAVHTHMTNTRITDPEIIEHRYPVRVDRFAIRCGSGGDGVWRGGDGVVRELTFLEPVALSVLTQHRVEAPFGIDGGKPGERGRQRIIRADGSELHLQSIDQCDVQPGDRLVLETPGGGGCET